jgi:hypothetical protein
MSATTQEQDMIEQCPYKVISIYRLSTNVWIRSSNLSLESVVVLHQSKAFAQSLAKPHEKNFARKTKRTSFGIVWHRLASFATTNNYCFLF